MVIFNSYVKLPEGTNNIFLVVSEHGTKTSPKRGHLHEESDDPNSNGGFFEMLPRSGSWESRQPSSSKKQIFENHF